MAAAKKRSQKGKDFVKAKVKLGKGKLKSANATDVSFSSRSIALGQQSIARDHAGVPTTKRNLTLEDLQTQLKHYNANTRKDALSGVRELLTSYPHLVTSAVGTLLPALARMVGDEETSVRKALQAFLSWYLPMLPKIVLRPYHSILLFFTTSAMSHIYPEIRHDAVRVLNILLDKFPESIALPWGHSGASEGLDGEDNLPLKVLECYLALLHIRSGIASNGLRTDMSPAMKALILSSLAHFIRISTLPQKVSQIEETHPHQQELPTWYMASAFPTQRAYESFLSNIANRRDDFISQSVSTPEDHGVPIASTSLLDQESFDALVSISDIYHSLRDSQMRTLQAEELPNTPALLLKTLLPILISAFLDSAPTAFSPESLSTPATSTVLESAQVTVLAVAHLAMDLLRSQLSRNMQIGPNTTLQDGLEKLIAHMTPYFPFGHTSKASPADEDRIQKLNTAFCELVALLSLETVQQDTMSSRKSRSGKSKLPAARWATEQYIRHLLSGVRSDDIIETATALTSQTYMQLLPAIWTLLWDSETVDSLSMLDQLLEHYLSCPASSAVKKTAFQFISRLSDVQGNTDQGTKNSTSGGEQLASNIYYEDFICSLPRYLWELGSRDVRLSQDILRYIGRATMSTKLPVVAMKKLAAYMAPYFHTEHPKRGAILGPWANIPSQNARKLALETAWSISDIVKEAGQESPLVTSVEAALLACDYSSLSTRWTLLRGLRV